VSNYTKSTNFATKDALASGNPLKIVKGTEIDTEFNNIATAVATKADLASPTFTGTPTLPTGTVAVTQANGSNTTTIATTAYSSNALFDTAEETGGSADAITVSHTHTATSTDSGHLHTQTEYNQPGIGNAGGGGARVNAVTANTGTGFANITTTVASAGSSGTNANYQPYITVYMWKRTA